MRVKGIQRYPFAKMQFYENSQCPTLKIRIYNMQEQAHVLRK